MNIKPSQFEKKSFNKFNLLCGKVEGRILDNAQIKAIINEEENNLVIAGAGTGKTTTIVGKIKYLVNKGVDPSNILVLSYTFNLLNYNFIATSHAPQITVRRFPTFLQSPTSGTLPLFASGAGR